MSSVVGIGTARQLTDSDGDLITGTNRFPVETEQDDAFSTFVSYPAIACSQSSANLATQLGVTVEDAKEIVIQVDDANTGYIMVGSSALLAVANATVTSRRGIKLNGGETLVIAISDFADVFLDASDSGQNMYIAYFK